MLLAEIMVGKGLSSLGLTLHSIRRDYLQQKPPDCYPLSVSKANIKNNGVKRVIHFGSDPLLR